MGLFDSIYLKCPGCGVELEVQTKAGECMMARYYESSVPIHLALHIKDEEVECGGWYVRYGEKGCGKKWRVEVPEVVSYVPVKLVSL
jgi:hypothetical protein